MNKNIDIKNIKVAKRYANALILNVTNSIDKVKDDLALIDEIIFSNEEFKTFFLHPIISLKDKKEMIEASLKNKIDEITLNFIYTLLDENRFGIFKTILEVFKQEADKIKNIQRIEVVSAISLNDEEKEKIKNKISNKIKKEVVLNLTNDKNILGGLIIKSEDKIIDLSLKTKFDELRKIN